MPNLDSNGQMERWNSGGAFSQDTAVITVIYARALLVRLSKSVIIDLIRCIKRYVIATMIRKLLDLSVTSFLNISSTPQFEQWQH